MKKLLLIFCGIFLLNISVVKADEGMWLLSLLNKNYEQMKQQGFRLTVEDIYNVNAASLKDAVVGLGSEGNPFRHSCSGEIISEKGLFSTNHHCGFSQIQSHSSVENDYFRDGFWAQNLREELKNDGMTASILVRMEDVTDSILAHINEKMTFAERGAVIDSISKIITARATEGTEYRAQVADMFASNQFFLLVYITYRDVRLVGAPPMSMGKFGGDTDNWEWPRHTADFALFRIYTDKDGNPATFSEDNIPLKPKHFFPISIKGIEEGDFAMIMGFPGTTERFLTSYGLQETMEVTNKLVHDIRTVKINVLRDEMAANQEIRIKYATKYARCSNYWKYTSQQNKALKKLNIMQVKQEIEQNYSQWAAQQENSAYSNALPKIRDAYKNRRNVRQALLYISEGLLAGPEILRFAFRQTNDIQKYHLEKNKAKKAEMKAKILKNIDLFFKDFDLEVERKLLVNMIDYTYQNLDRNYFPSFFESVLEKKFKGNVQKYVDFLLANTIFTSKEKIIALINNEKLLENYFKQGEKDKDCKKCKFMNDAAFYAGFSADSKLSFLRESISGDNDNIREGMHYFVGGILKMNDEYLGYEYFDVDLDEFVYVENRPIAPDANSTIRFTYGNILSYEPRDAVTYRYYTTLKGVMEKENPSSTEFIVPQKLKELFEARDFGQYADKNGELPVCFISNNDITGGNSGSPVLDGDGNLIGIAFDGNGEAMSGDIDFEKNLQRCINVDVRYMLFIIDKFAGAKHLIDEMKIVK